MSLRILFADDSVTAQNMGKKILTEAGYDVVAVSNGAAAVKKIAEQKPDIIILDVHMPGYTGLEVCEKVRGSIETVKTPVLLTVGKLEPFKPEETNRVRADGVIVKPFEASDLLATVKKFEERLGQAAAVPPLVQRSMAEDRLDATDSTEHPEHTMSIKVPQATVEVPDPMAMATGFCDRLGSDLAQGLDPINANQSGPGREVAGRSDACSAPTSDYELPVSCVKDVASMTLSATGPPSNQAGAQEPRSTPLAPTSLRPRQIPFYEGGEPSGAPEMLPTAVVPMGDVLIPRGAYFQESDAETTRNTVADNGGPGLLPTIEEASRPLIQATAENTRTATHEARPRLVEATTVELSSGPRLVARTAGTQDLEAVETKISESDFEARVAGVAQAHNQATAARDSASMVAENAVPAERDVSPSESAKKSLSTHVQEAAPSAGAETVSDRNTIAEAVHRVIERLKPELVEEIVKELKAKK